MSLPALLAAELRRDGARPFLTWYDDASGERVELSVATLANWAVKTANLLADEHGLEPGDAVRLSPADHWLSFVAVLGAAYAGVRLDDSAPVAVPGDPVAFTSAVLPQPDVLLVPATGHEPFDGVHAPHGMRLMSTETLGTESGVRRSLVAPLSASGSVVFVTNADAWRLADRARMERVTHTAGCEVEGLPHLA